MPSNPIIPDNHMSSRPGTVYGEILKEERAYDPCLLPESFWQAMPQTCTKVDLQYDDRFATEVQCALTKNGIIIPSGYRPIDVRHTGKEFSAKGYIYVSSNPLMELLIKNIPQDMGRPGSNGVRIAANGRLRLASWWMAVCALKRGYALHMRTRPSRYQIREQKLARYERRYGVPVDMFGNIRLDIFG